MAVAWPEPDMGLLSQTYENRRVLTKSNVKKWKKKISRNFQFCGYLRMQRAGSYLELPKGKQKEIMREAGKSRALRKKCGQQW